MDVVMTISCAVVVVVFATLGYILFYEYPRSARR
jgi:hypothetical protein